MSVVNCRTICREIEEAGYGENLTPSAVEHLLGCGQCNRFYDERLKLRQLVASLETVAAPADFNARVRSRIANERVGARAGFWFSNFTIAIPSLALASLVLTVGGAYALRVWNAPTTVTEAVQSVPPGASEPGHDMQRLSTESGVKAGADNRELATTRDDNKAIQRDRLPNKRNPGAVTGWKNGARLATREFGISPAPVIKKEEAVASLESPIFPIETSSQPLRLSVDYSGGVSRTISVPALSFGSERVLTEGSSPLVKNSPKGAW